MKENLEIRKAALYNQLQEQYAADPLYSEAAAVDTGGLPFPELAEVRVSPARSDKAVFATIFLVVSALYLIYKIHNNGSGPLSMLLLLAWIGTGIYFISRHLHAGACFIFDQEKISVQKPLQIIRWDEVVASFIRTEQDVETMQHYLVIYYYEPAHDTFETTEIKLDDLNHTPQAIAGYFVLFLKQKMMVE